MSLLILLLRGSFNIACYWTFQTIISGHVDEKGIKVWSLRSAKKNMKMLTSQTDLTFLHGCLIGFGGYMSAD